MKSEKPSKRAFCLREKNGMNSEKTSKRAFCLREKNGSEAAAPAQRLAPGEHFILKKKPPAVEEGELVSNLKEEFGLYAEASLEVLAGKHLLFYYNKEF